jgi:hypothetical protein
MPNEEALVAVRQLIIDKEALAQKLEDALIHQGNAERELFALRNKQEEIDAFVKAAKEITGRPGLSAVGELISQVRAKISGLEYKLEAREKDIHRVSKSRDGYYDSLKLGRNLIESAIGGTIPWKVSLTDWLKDELPKIVKKEDPALQERIEFVAHLLKDATLLKAPAPKVITRLVDELNTVRDRVQYLTVTHDEEFDNLADLFEDMAERVRNRNDDEGDLLGEYETPSIEIDELEDDF